MLASPANAALFWLACAAGILLKGPITPMVAGLAALGLGVTSGRWRWLRGLRAGWGVPLMLLAVLPWFVAIGVATHGRFFSDAVGGDLAGKLQGGDDAHGGPPGLHLLLTPVLMLAAFVPAACALPELWRGRRRPAERLLLCWLLPAWAVFELVPTKLPHYTLPLYPALCLAGALWAVRDGRAPRWLRRGATVLFAAAAAAFGLGALALPFVLARMDPGGPAVAWWLGVPGLLAAGLLGWAGLRGAPAAAPGGAAPGGAGTPATPGPGATVAGPGAARGTVQGMAPGTTQGTPGRTTWNTGRAWAAVLASAALFWAVLGLELPRAAPLWIAPRAEALLRARWPGWNAGGAGLAAVGFAEPSLQFLAGTAVQDLPSARAGAEALRDGTAGAVLVGDRDLAAFRAAAAAMGVPARAAGTVAGVNYSRGRAVALTLFVR